MKRGILPVFMMLLSFSIWLSLVARRLRARYSSFGRALLLRQGSSDRSRDASAESAGFSSTSRKYRVFEVPIGQWNSWHRVLMLIMLGVSELGKPFSGVVLIASAAAWLVHKRRKVESIFVLATCTGPTLSFLLKVVTHHARPKPGFERGFLSTFNRYSFPSGHVVFFVVFFGFLGYLAKNYLTGGLRWLAMAFSSSLILLVGPSRVLLGAHWASDVAGGYIIGGVWLTLLTMVYRTVRKC